MAHNHNKRGINVEGAFVQWGDGTGDRFFLPGNRDTVYINLHERRMRSHLVFDYNGPVTLSAPISGGIYHDTMDAVGQETSRSPGPPATRSPSPTSRTTTGPPRSRPRPCCAWARARTAATAGC
ncbi:hypothetical protein GCM10029992_46460 [Glycomyces albus]